MANLLNRKGQHRRCRSWGGLSAGVALCVLLLGGNSTVRANLIISPTFDATITSDPNAAAIEATILQAIQTYQSTYSDPITVKITFQGMTTGLGQSNTWIYNLSYSTFRTALISDAKTADDAFALAHIPVSSTNPVTGTSTIDIKTANIRALGIAGSFPSGLAGGVDGIIGLNTSITNITRTSIDPNKYDLLAVAEHEIDEVLGLGSMLPTPFLNSPAPQDLFRYSLSGSRSFTTSGDDAYFSLDGTTKLARFNQSSGGDYGDWWSVGAHTPQVQDAFGTPGATQNLGVELTALDVIGYDRLPSATVPEPSSLLLCGLGALSLAGYVWRKRTVNHEQAA